MATDINQRALLEGLADMDPEAFEHFVAELYEMEGWRTEATDFVGDEGVDVSAIDDGATSQTLGIQVKRNAPDNKVKAPTVRDIFSASADHRDYDGVAVVTTSEFTSDAYEYAYRNEIDLVPGSDLYEMIVENNAYSLVAKYGDAGLRTEWADQVTGDVSEVTERPREQKPAKPKTEIRGYYLAVVVTMLALLIGTPLVFDRATELVGAMLMVVGMIGGPIAIFLDALSLRKYDANYQPSTLWAFGALMTMGFIGLWYAVRRALRTDIRATYFDARDLEEPD